MPVSQERLRKITWAIGAASPPPATAGTPEVHFAFVNPRLGFAWWTPTPASDAGTPLLRIHDVTDVIFDGTNAHDSFDITLQPGQDRHYLHHDRLGRHLLAELAIREPDGSIRSLARSNAVEFDRDGPATETRHDGLFVAPRHGLVFPIENIFDAPLFEHLAADLPAAPPPAPLHIAIVSPEPPPSAPLSDLIRALRRIGCDTTVHPPSGEPPGESPSAPETARIVYARGRESFARAIALSRTLKARLILHLDSAEEEWPPAAEGDSGTMELSQWLAAADLVAVDHASTREILTRAGGLSAERIVIIDAPRPTGSSPTVDPGTVKQRLHLHPDRPMALFCGELSHAAGADLLVDCLHHVCSEYPQAQFVLAGDGPLRGELEARMRHLGLEGRVRFTGDIPRHVFDELIQACDFVVIPARTWQGEGVARAAIEAGRPVLATHQAHLDCVKHGENGLLAYDNPSSITWGLKEMLANPMRDRLRRTEAEREAGHSADVAAFELYVACRRLFAGEAPGGPSARPEGRA